MEFPAQICAISYIWDFQSVVFWSNVACFSSYEGQGKQRGANSSVVFDKSLLELPHSQVQNNYKPFSEAASLLSSDSQGQN